MLIPEILNAVPTRLLETVIVDIPLVVSLTADILSPRKLSVLIPVTVKPSSSLTSIPGKDPEAAETSPQ